MLLITGGRCRKPTRLWAGLSFGVRCLVTALASGLQRARYLGSGEHPKSGNRILRLSAARLGVPYERSQLPQPARLAGVSRRKGLRPSGRAIGRTPRHLPCLPGHSARTRRRPRYPGWPPAASGSRRSSAQRPPVPGCLGAGHGHPGRGVRDERADRERVPGELAGQVSTTAPKFVSYIASAVRRVAAARDMSWRRHFFSFAGWTTSRFRSGPRSAARRDVEECCGLHGLSSAALFFPNRTFCRTRKSRAKMAKPV